MYDQITASASGVLGLLNGESAIGILPISTADAAALANSNFSGLPLAGLFGVKDPTAAGGIVASLLALTGGSGSQSSALTPTKLANGNTEYSNGAGYGYATLSNWLVASTAIKNVVASIQAVLSKPSDSLAASSIYLQAASGLPNTRPPPSTWTSPPFARSWKGWS